MKSIDINTSSCSGCVIQFTYNAGSNPGSRRTVCVHDQDSRLVGGYDFVRDAYRQFRVSEMSNVKILEVKDGAFEVDVDQLPQNLTMSYMVNAYQNEGFRTYQSTDNILVCVKKSIIEPPTPVARCDSQGLHITGPGGQMNVCGGGVSNNTRLTMNGVRVRSAATPKDILACIEQVMNG